MDIGHLVPDILHDRVRNIDEMACRDRIEEMLAAEIAVTKVKAELDVVRHRFANPHETFGDVVL